MYQASGSDSSIQTIVDDAAEWALNNMVQLNADKTKEVMVSFSQTFHSRDLPTLLLEGTEFERIASVKLLRVVIASDLSWAGHVDYLCAKANQRPYFMCFLRRAGATLKDMITFYKSIIRSVVE